MAVIQNPVIGRAKQQAGGMVFSTWKGKNVMRAKPIAVANPKTEAQEIQRAKIAYLAKFAASLRPMYEIGLKSEAVGQSEWNAFSKNNLPLVTTSGVPPVGEIDWSQLITSKGVLQQNVVVDTVAKSGGNVVVTLDAGLNTYQPSGQNGTFRFLAFIQDGVTLETSSSFVDVAGTSTSDTITIPLPFGTTNLDSVGVLGMVFRASDGAVSNSFWVGLAPA